MGENYYGLGILWRLFLFCVSIIALACVTTIPQNSKTNGVTYLRNMAPYLDQCKFLGNIIGVPTSIWGGEVGNSQARIDALRNARSIGATHFVETDSNWTDGNVAGSAYKCKE